MEASRVEKIPQPDGSGLTEVGKGLISSKARDCKSLFAKSLQACISNGKDDYELVLWKFEQKFFEWAAYLGVFAGANRSLDQRLERHPHYRDLILTWLDMLTTNLLQSKILPRISLGLQAN